jgi:hypothetical protein
LDTNRSRTLAFQLTDYRSVTKRLTLEPDAFGNTLHSQGVLLLSTPSRNGGVTYYYGRLLGSGRQTLGVELGLEHVQVVGVKKGEHPIEHTFR